MWVNRLSLHIAPADDYWKPVLITVEAELSQPSVIPFLETSNWGFDRLSVILCLRSIFELRQSHIDRDRLIPSNVTSSWFNPAISTNGDTVCNLSETNSDDISLNTGDLCGETYFPNIYTSERKIEPGRNRRNLSTSPYCLAASHPTEPNLDEYPWPTTTFDRTSHGWLTTHNAEATRSLEYWRGYWDRSSFRPIVQPLDDDCHEIDLAEFPWASGDIDWDRWDSLRTNALQGFLTAVRRQPSWSASDWVPCLGQWNCCRAVIL